MFFDTKAERFVPRRNKKVPEMGDDAPEWDDESDPKFVERYFVERRRLHGRGFSTPMKQYAMFTKGLGINPMGGGGSLPPR